MIPRLWLAIIVCGALVASHGFAWVKGRAAANEAHAAALTRAVEARDALETDLRAAAITIEFWRDAQSTRATEAENAAMADPGTRVPSDASRLRLQGRWSDPAP